MNFKHVLGVGLIGLSSCTHLPPAEVAAIGQLVENAFDAACPEEALIPMVGPVLAAACPGEDALVQAAINAAIAAETPSATTARTTKYVSLASAHQAPLFANRTHNIAYKDQIIPVTIRAEIGKCLPEHQATAQLFIDSIKVAR